MSAFIATHKSDIVLVRRAFQRKSAKHEPWISLALLMGMAVIFIWLVSLELEVDLWELARKLYEHNPGKLAEILSALIAVVLFTWIPFVRSRDKIVINSTGIAFKTPVPSWFPDIISGWVLPWSRVRDVDIRLSVGASQLILVINDDAGRHRKILIDAWILSEEEPKKPTLKDIFLYQKVLRVTTLEEMKARAETSPLIQALRAKNVVIRYPEAVGTGLMLDLQSSLRTKLAVVVLLGLLFYAIGYFFYQ